MDFLKDVTLNDYVGDKFEKSQPVPGIEVPPMLKLSSCSLLEFLYKTLSVKLQLWFPRSSFFPLSLPMSFPLPDPWKL